MPINKKTTNENLLTTPKSLSNSCKLSIPRGAVQDNCVAVWFN